MAGFHFNNAKGRISHEDVPLENTIVCDPTAGASERNVYTSFAEALTAICAMEGPRTLKLHGDFSSPHVWPTGSYDLFGVVLLGAIRDSTTIQIPDGVTWTRMPSAILGGMYIEFQNTSGPVYSGDGSDFDLDIDATPYQTGAAVPIVINDASGVNFPYIRWKGTSNPSYGTVALIRLENSASLTNKMYDQSIIEGPLYPDGAWPFEDDGLGGTSLYMEQVDITVDYQPPDLSNPPTGDVFPSGFGKVAHLSIFNTPALIRRADGTYQGLSDFADAGNFITPDPETTNPQWRHAIWAHMPMIQSFRIFPKGISGNDLLMDGILTGSTLTTSTITTSLPSSNNPHAIQANISTSGALNDEAGWITPVIGNRRTYMKTWFWFNIQSITNVRFFVGLTDQTTRGNNTNADDPAGANMAGLQFSTARGDTEWQFMIKNGATQTLVPNTVAGTPVTTGPYMLEISLSDGPEGSGGAIYMRLYNAISGPSGAGAWSFTTDIFGRDTQLALVASITALNAAVKTFGTMGVVGTLGPA